MKKIICDIKSRKIIIFDKNRSTTITTMIDDFDNCYYVLNNILEEGTIFLDDIIALNDENKAVKVVSACESGENCVTKAFEKAFLDIGIINTACILITVGKDVSEKYLLQVTNLLNNSTLFSPDGTFIWKANHNDVNEKNAKIIAIIFS